MRSRRRQALVPAALLATAAVWTGCSIEEHYELLSFFFDGVPDPNAPPWVFAGDGDGDDIAWVYHEPFREGRCRDCHVTAGEFGMSVTGFADLDSAVCLNCHETVTREYPYMHGPVGAMACLYCHSPHQTRHPNLLKMPSPDLCLSCHDLVPPEEVPIPEHEDLERDCLECHGGHGGEVMYFLRDRVDTEGEERDPEIVVPSVEDET